MIHGGKGIRTLGKDCRGILGFMPQQQLYQELFRFFNFRQIVSEVLIILMISSFLIQGYFTDRSSGMKQLIRSSCNGRDMLNKEKLFICELLLIGISIIVHLMEFANIRNTCGLHLFRAPACSLEFLPAETPAALLVYMVLFYLIRTAVLFILLLVCFASGNRKS